MDKKQEFGELTVGEVLCGHYEGKFKILSQKEHLLSTGWKQIETTTDGKRVFTKRSSIWGQG